MHTQRGPRKESKRHPRTRTLPVSSYVEHARAQTRVAERAGPRTIWANIIGTIAENNFLASQCAVCEHSFASYLDHRAILGGNKPCTVAAFGIFSCFWGVYQLVYVCETPTLQPTSIPRSDAAHVSGEFTHDSFNRVWETGSAYRIWETGRDKRISTQRSRPYTPTGR